MTYEDVTPNSLLREHQVICASIQRLSDCLAEFTPEHFDYIIVDEAHHAPADTYKRLLGYLRPKFILGLTATPDRPDGQSVLSFFQDSAHQMSIEEAVSKGELVPIRCVRVKTNVDLTRVRFNQIQYNAHDLENAVFIPSRDQLIVETWLRHVKDRRTVRQPDHKLELGDRTYYYFAKNRIQEIREVLGIPEVTPETIKLLFFEFIDAMDMAASYKPVLMLAFLDSANSRGRARMTDVVRRFREFYEGRAEQGVIMERETMRMARVTEMTDGEVQNVIVSMPLRKFQQRRYLEYARDVAWLKFNEELWRRLSDIDLDHVRQLCNLSIDRYYARITPTG